MKNNITREVAVGRVVIGGYNPIRIQSMTNTPTLDIRATVNQTLQLANAGCEIVRITAQNLVAAQTLKDIKRELVKAGCQVPLVADIHFLPQAALEAIEHVDKVRINPGNYADKKQTISRDLEYVSELQKVSDRFSPLVRRAKELGKALRIGVNHGSLSDRIVNRYGDTPQGMVESAMEFIRIAESHGFYQLVLSLKSSNTVTMIQAYRLMVRRMLDAGMNYPLHIGVTESGFGEEGEIKSAIGIGALLMDGIGDTIRVSLTGDPLLEIPVAQKLAALSPRKERMCPLSEKETSPTAVKPTGIWEQELPYVGRKSIPRVIASLSNLDDFQAPADEAFVNKFYPDDIKSFCEKHPDSLLILNFDNDSDLQLLEKIEAATCLKAKKVALCSAFAPDTASFLKLVDFAKKYKQTIVADALWMNNLTSPKLDAIFSKWPDVSTLFTLSKPLVGLNATDSYRYLCKVTEPLKAPVWIRITPENLPPITSDFQGKSIKMHRPSEPSAHQKILPAALLQAAAFGGSLLCDGIGDFISIEGLFDPEKSLSVAYNILQGARRRFSKTEFIICPSCGRTLYDIDNTAKLIKQRLGNLPNVTIAVMGCIVNGPGEMADADFGYVGGTPGTVNLYIGKTCVESAIPESQALDRLVSLIEISGKSEKTIVPQKRFPEPLTKRS